MTQENNLGKWIREKFGSQTQMALKLGVNPTMISRWMNGAGISDDYKAKIRKLGYSGPWPHEEAQEAQTAGVSREDHWKLVGRVEAIERAFERLAEGVRELAIRDEERRKREA